MSIDLSPIVWGQNPDFSKKSGFLRLNNLSDRYFGERCQKVGTETRLFEKVGFLAYSFSCYISII
jgi:hypothetical protein